MKWIFKPLTKEPLSKKSGSQQLSKYVLIVGNGTRHWLRTIRQNMVYTDAMTEEDQATPSDVEKELCLVCHEEIWDLGEVNDSFRHQSICD